MKITISTQVCKRENMELAELYALLLIDKLDGNYGSIGDLFDRMEEKGWIQKDMYDNISVLKDIDDKINTILYSRDPEVPEEQQLIHTAIKMQEYFPQGKKDGTNYYWRCNRTELLGKLRVFYKLYGYVSEEEILDATRRYVASFNGDYRFMKLAKYFILKQNVPAGGTIEQVSELATFLENKGQDDTTNNDWTTTLI